MQLVYTTQAGSMVAYAADMSIPVLEQLCQMTEG